MSEDPAHPPPEWGWTAPQARVLLVFLALLWLGLCARYACQSGYVSDPQPVFPPRAEELADRIDPNTADWQTLAALPGIGEKRARDIVAHREQVLKRNPGRPAFEKSSDLLRIRGIGPAIVSTIEPYLFFPETRPIDPPPQ